MTNRLYNQFPIKEQILSKYYISSDDLIIYVELIVLKA
jgi:hypothetical protein